MNTYIKLDFDKVTYGILAPEMDEYNVFLIKEFDTEQDAFDYISNSECVHYIQIYPIDERYDKYAEYPELWEGFEESIKSYICMLFGEKMPLTNIVKITKLNEDQRNQSGKLVNVAKLLSKIIGLPLDYVEAKLNDTHSTR